MAVKSVVFGTCLLNGQHPAGSKLARECPLLNKAKRAEARRGASRRRDKQSGTPENRGAS